MHMNASSGEPMGLGMGTETTRASSMVPGTRGVPANLESCLGKRANTGTLGIGPVVASRALGNTQIALRRVLLGAEKWTAAELAQALLLDLSGVDRAASQLADRGLVRRRRLLSDRRVVIQTLTEDGTALTEDLHRLVQAYDDSLHGGTSEEQMAILGAVSSRIMANHSALNRAHSPEPRIKREAWSRPEEVAGRQEEEAKGEPWKR